MLWVMDYEQDETFDELVERIAKKFHETPCPAEENKWCQPVHHVWATAHPEDKQWGRDRVAFVLREIGLDG